MTSCAGPRRFRKAVRLDLILSLVCLFFSPNNIHALAPLSPLVRGIVWGEPPVPLGSSGLTIGPLGLGTWSWGNKLLWGYSTDNDEELRQVFSSQRLHPNEI